MKKPVWHETTWLGAEGVAKKIEQAWRKHHPPEAKSLEGLLSKAEWKQSGFSELDGWATVQHPSGATARVRLVPLTKQVCHKRDCKKNMYDAKQCSKCERRTCPHLIDFNKLANADLCSGCAPFKITYMHGVTP